MDELDLRAAMRAAPAAAEPRLAYAAWLRSRGDARGELIVLDEAERAGSPMTIETLDRLLALAAAHGFPRLPDDPCADVLRWAGGGAYPVQYFLAHGPAVRQFSCRCGVAGLTCGAEGCDLGDSGRR